MVSFFFKWTGDKQDSSLDTPGLCLSSSLGIIQKLQKSVSNVKTWAVMHVQAGQDKIHKNLLDLLKLV